MEQTNPMSQSYGPTRYPMRDSGMNEESGMTRERWLLMAAGVLQALVARKWLRNVVLSMVGTMVFSLIVRMLRRSQRAKRKGRR
jgi:hypothetical protein